MSTFRSLRSRPSSRLRHVASHAALLGLAVVALVGTTGCATCCRPCPPPCYVPCCPPPGPYLAPPPGPVVIPGVSTLSVEVAKPPPPVAPGATADPAVPEAKRATVANVVREAVPETCRSFLVPPNLRSVPDVIGGPVPFGPGQLDMGGFVLWQVQGNTWIHVGWVLRLEGSLIEHWVYKPNFSYANSVNQANAGAAWTLSFESMNPSPSDMPTFWAKVREMNEGTTSGLTYQIHRMSPGTLPPP